MPVRNAKRCALVLTAILLGCAPGLPENLIVITLDTTRADHLGAYGNPLPISPHLDALAARGVVFENAYAPMPQTLPTHATLFSGLDPRLHGALENAYVLSDEIETLAEVFQAAGYHTAGVIAALVLSPATGIAQGFEHFDRPDREADGAVRRVVRRSARKVTDAALAWSDAVKAEAPYLLWVHYYDPHDPYDPPRPALAAIESEAVQTWLGSTRRKLDHGTRKRQRVVETWRRYAAEIRGMDAEIGRLLEGLASRGLMQRTNVLVIGDHGEGLYEHGVTGHGSRVYEELMRVPFIVARPNGEGAGHRVQARVTAADVMPTVLEVVLRQPSARKLTGRSLAGALAGRGEPDARPVFVERPHFSKKRIRRHGSKRKHPFGILAAVIDSDFKLIRRPGRADALYDLGNDPEEITDLAGADATRAHALGAMLDEWESSYPVAEPGSNSDIGAEQLEALRALGYIDSDEE